MYTVLIVGDRRWLLLGPWMGGVRAELSELLESGHVHCVGAGVEVLTLRETRVHIFRGTHQLELEGNSKAGVEARVGLPLGVEFWAWPEST